MDEIDPQVKNLVSAIGQAETGPSSQEAYSKKGASGEFGRYQFMPNTWKEWAGEQLGDQNAPMTMENQNKVAYNKVSQWKKDGLNPAQIASKWNSGNENAYLEKHVGTNDQGVAYDTPAYAQKVSQYYNQLKGQNPQPTSQTETSQSYPNIGTILGQQPIENNPNPNLKSNLKDALFGLGGLAAGGAAIAFAPEIAGAASSIPLLGKLLPGVEATLGVEGAANTVKGLLGGNQTPNTGTSNTSSSQGDINAINQDFKNQDIERESEQDMQRALQASQNISKTVSDSAMQTQAGAKLMQTQAGIEGTRTIGHNGFTPDIENGKQNWANAINDAGTKSAELDKIENELHDAEGAKGNISQISEKAKEIVRKTLPSTDWEEAYKYIDKDAQSYRKNFGHGGDIVPLGSGGVGRIRNEGYKAYDRNASTAKNGARKALGSAANAHMLENTKHKELIGGLHKEKQKLAYAQKVMTHLNGKKAPENKGVAAGVLRHYGQYLGIAIGDKIGGGLGAVIGSMIGDNLIKAVDKKYGKSEFESPAVKKGLEILKKKNPKVYKLVEEELKKYEIAVEKEQKMENQPKNTKKKHKGLIKS